MYSTIKRLYQAFYPNSPSKDEKPLKFGILGAAAIAPPALIIPAKSHPEVVIYAVAARDLTKATSFAKKHNIEKVYGGQNGYQELLDDPEIDAVYNPLPNGLHYEWTMKALLAGKHVLLEKPATNITEEVRAIFELAEKKNLVVLEAFHYRFHPAIRRIKEIVDSGELGTIKSIHTELAMPSGSVKLDDIRYNYALGGGALMDMGCYTLSFMRYLAGAEPTSVLDVHVKEAKYENAPHTKGIDEDITATLSFPNDVVGSMHSSFVLPSTLGFIPGMPKVSAKVECTEGSVELFNFPLPTLYHTITVITKKNGATKMRKEKAYTHKDLKGEDWWLTYRYQLEAFVDRLKGRQPQTWVDKEDSIANMSIVEQIYEKSGLGQRPKSEYVAPAA